MARATDTPLPAPAPAAATSPIPSVNLRPGTSSVGSGPAINGVATSAQERNAQIAAENAPIRIPYGRQTMGGNIADVMLYGGDLIIVIVWGEGPVDAIEAFYVDDLAPPSSIVATHYTGTQVAADPTLVAAYATQSPPITYTDILPGIAYSVVKLPPGVTSGFPRFSAIIRGLLTYDPRIGGTTYTPMASALEFTSNATGGGNCFVYHKILAPAYVVQSGDVLRYDVFIDQNNLAQGGVGSIEVDLDNTPFNGRSAGLVDQNGHLAASYNPASVAGAIGGWTTRNISLTPIVGNTVNAVDLVNESNVAGAYRSLYRNIRITDAGGGTVRLAIWSAGPPTLNVTNYSALVTNIALAEAKAVRYSENPALALADLQVNATYGAAGAIDWASVYTTAEACDAYVGGVEKRRTLGLVIDSAQPIDQWFETLRTYAGCFLARNGAQLRLIPDRPAASSFTFSETSTPATCRVRNLKRRTRRDTPTVCAVRYTNTSAYPWRDALVYAYAPGALANTVPWKIREIALPGITRSTQALREATEQLNKLRLLDIVCDVEGQDEALAVVVGDVVTVTANVGLVGKAMRVLNAAMPTLGRPVFGVEAYDQAVYSDSVQAAPSVTDTTLPNPNQPPAPSSLVLTEELFQLNSGAMYYSRLKITCALPASFPAAFVRGYRVEVSLAGAIVNSGAPSVGEYRTPQLSEGNTYVVNVWIVSSTGALSTTPATASLLVTGSPPTPADVADFVARPINSRVFMTWSLNPERDVSDYEIRYAATNSWSAGTLIARVPGSNFIADALPAGTWYFMIKARNMTRTTASPAGVYSTNAASVQLTLALDTANLVRAFFAFVSPTLTNMASYTLPGDATKYYITDAGDGVGFGADNTDNAVGTFGDSLVNRVFAAPRTSGAAEWLSETYDYGQALFGDWNFAGNIVALDGGTYVVTLQLKVNSGDAFTDYTTFPARVNARYARLKIQALTTNVMQVKQDPIGPAVTLDVAYKSETFTVTTSATLPVSVTLTGKYSLYKAIPMSPKGTTAKMAVYNNVVLSPTGANSFDVYAFNDAGAQVSVEVTGTFQGI